MKTMEPQRHRDTEKYRSEGLLCVSVSLWLNRLSRLLLIGLLCVGFVAGSGPAYAAPSIEHWVTPSGARVFLVENHDLPMLDIQVDFAAGSAYDPPAQAGLAARTGALLDLGLADLDATQIAGRLADLGAQLSGGVDMDRASVRLRTLSADEQRVPALDLLRDILSRPQFSPDVLAREQARTVAALKEALTQPGAIASRAFWSALYPQHPYGRQATPESVSGLQPSDLIAFHRARYTARQATLTLVGDLTRAQAEALARELTASWPNGSEPLLSAAPALPPASEVPIAHPAAQAHVLIGLPALQRGDPDYFPLIVGNYTLGGGGFVSRLMQEVREKRGLVYGVQSYFMPMLQPGPFQIGLQTRKSQAREALSVVRDVLTGFLADGPTEAELRAAKQNLVGSFPLRLDSNRKILDNVSVIGFYGLPLDYLDHYTENVEKVTAAEIKAAFARHVQPEHMVTVVVGGE